MTDIVLPAHPIGSRVPLLDGPDKLMGRARYTADLPAQGALAGKILRSAKGHAEIVAVDTSTAEAMPGELVLEPRGGLRGLEVHEGVTQAVAPVLRGLAFVAGHVEEVVLVRKPGLPDGRTDGWGKSKGSRTKPDLTDWLIDDA